MERWEALLWYSSSLKGESERKAVWVYEHLMWNKWQNNWVFETRGGDCIPGNDHDCGFMNNFIMLWWCDYSSAEHKLRVPGAVISSHDGAHADADCVLTCVRQSGRETKLKRKTGRKKCSSYFWGSVLCSLLQSPQIFSPCWCHCQMLSTYIWHSCMLFTCCEPNNPAAFVI